LLPSDPGRSTANAPCKVLPPGGLGEPDHQSTEPRLPRDGGGERSGESYRAGTAKAFDAINHAGNLALVANRNDKSISVLSIQGNEVKLIDTVSMGDEVASVAITPDGKRALATKFPAHKIAMLEINGQKVTDIKHDMPVGLWPYNIDITPDGKIGISADNGNSGAPDGHIDTVSIIDLEHRPPKVIDRVVSGTRRKVSPSPKGNVAVAVLLGGASVPKTMWFNTKRNGSLAVLKIDGKKVTKVDEVEVGGLPEGVVWSSDGKYLYVGNYTPTATSPS
jgi:DNA-binding beta-propeller fold protein YncE